MDLAAIGAFVAVGERGGFRAAAAVLGMTSSGVSKAVARLEHRLGVALLTRTTRSVRLTPAGLAFHTRCRAILTELDTAGREAAASATVPRGRLTVSASVSYGRMRVLPAIAEFADAYPQVEIAVRLGDRVVDLVAEGVDLAVRIGHLPDSGLVATRIAQTGFVLCGSPAYLGRAGVPTHPDELTAHAFVGYVTPGTAERFAYRFRVDGAVRSLSVSTRVTVDDGEALVEAALGSLGLIMVNDYLVDSLVADGRLVRVLREFETGPVPVSAVHVPTRTPSPARRALVDLLRRRERRSPG